MPVAALVAPICAIALRTAAPCDMNPAWDPPPTRRSVCPSAPGSAWVPVEPAEDRRRPPPRHRMLYPLSYAGDDFLLLLMEIKYR